MKPQQYFQFNDELSPFKNNQWQKGGMSSNGLRQAGEVINHFRGPGRQNLIPNAVATADLSTTDPSFKKPVSSIGLYQTSGLKQIASGPSGPGTLQKANIQNHISVIKNESQQGYVMQNDKRSQFVNYRNTDPTLVENLRQNPLSIYAVGKAKDAPIPAFFSFIQPENYETYTSEPSVHISQQTKQLSLDGSPNVNILGLAFQNPLMGITTGIPNTTPQFTGKTYGGNDDGDAKPYAEELYNQIWTTNTLQAVEGFGQDNCQNKALSTFAQGYNVAPQLISNTMIEWVDKNRHGVNNLPWGPMKSTGNPQTQQGGIWTGGQNPRPTVIDSIGYRNSPHLNIGQMPPIKQNNSNPYKNGLPGSLISN